jgi:carbon monoxide dehydrogenase subunit G
MQIKLDKTFNIDSSEAEAWELLQNISSVAECMPGAHIVNTLDDTHYKGEVKTKIGPASMIFSGDIEVLELDEHKHEMHLLGKGQDKKGSSTAEMDLTATVVPVDDTHSELHGVATVTVNGKVASLGGRMMNQVAEQILEQFGKNFVDNVQHAKQIISAAQAANDEHPAANEEHIEAVEPTPTPAPAKELNAFAFAWQVFVGYIKSFFTKDDKAKS